jgi:hypothetical protein
MYQFNCNTDALHLASVQNIPISMGQKKILSQYFHTMMISTAATISSRPCKIPSQDWVCHNRPHRNMACNHPAARFSQIRSILREIAPFLQCKFCFTVAITTGRREDDNLMNVRNFY